jgi:hypothetical protein
MRDIPWKVSDVVMLCDQNAEFSAASLKFMVIDVVWPMSAVGWGWWRCIIWLAAVAMITATDNVLAN